MINDWLESNIGDVIEASNGTELRVNCPFCESRIGRPDDKHHMYVSTQMPVAICFRCTWQGNYISLIISASGCNYAEALKQLESPTPNVSRFNKLIKPTGLLGLSTDALMSRPDRFRNFDIGKETSSKEELAVWNYLSNRRHIPHALIYKYMGWAPGTNRAWILVDINFWQGRLIISGDPKYISSPWPKGDSIWNASALDTYNITICEGVFSAIAVGSHAIALCGKTISQLQAKRIAKSRVRNITVMLDADATKYSYGVAKTLEEAGFIGVLKIHELESGDPTDSTNGDVVNYDWGTNVRRVLATV